MRDHRLYLDDILESIKRIERYTRTLSPGKLKRNTLALDGVVRNLEIIGEAAKNLPARIKENHADVEWGKLAGLRNILAHEYFGVDTDIVWDIVKNKLPVLKKKVRRMSKDKPQT